MSIPTTLDKFLGLMPKRRVYFYTDWRSSLPQSQWLLVPPTGCNFQVQVQWKEVKYPITICGSVLVSDQPANLTSSRGHHTMIPLLKSNLQKAVRRQLTEVALSTAYELIKLDLNELLRRLPIIMIEDVSLLSSFCPLVWLMSAVSKGYRPSQSQLLWVLGVVKQLCQCSMVEDIINPMSLPAVGTCIKSLESMTLDDYRRDCVYSLYFRCAYGGMDGDMLMLRRLAHLYMSGSMLRSEASGVPVVTFDTILPLEILVESADFHCFPKLLSQIGEKFVDLSENDIKLAIWHHSSKINTRKPQETLDEHLVVVWTQIENLTRTIQWELIKVITFR